MERKCSASDEQKSVGKQIYEEELTQFGISLKLEVNIEENIKIEKATPSLVRFSLNQTFLSNFTRLICKENQPHRAALAMRRLRHKGKSCRRPVK